MAVCVRLRVSELHADLKHALKTSHDFKFTSIYVRIPRSLAVKPTLVTTATPPSSLETRPCKTHLKASFTWMMSSLSTATLFSLSEKSERKPTIQRQRWTPRCCLKSENKKKCPTSILSSREANRNAAGFRNTENC